MMMNLLMSLNPYSTGSNSNLLPVSSLKWNWVLILILLEVTQILNIWMTKGYSTS